MKVEVRSYCHLLLLLADFKSIKMGKYVEKMSKNGKNLKI